jgi:hypothetical protein
VLAAGVKNSASLKSGLGRVVLMPLTLKKPPQIWKIGHGSDANLVFRTFEGSNGQNFAI